LGIRKKHTACTELSYEVLVLLSYWPSYRPCSLNRHLGVMKIRTDQICSECGEEEETSVHFLGKCPATIVVRHSILGSYFLRLDELRCIQPHAVMRFARASTRLPRESNTRLSDCGVIYEVGIDHRGRLPGFSPLTVDVNWFQLTQLTPQRLSGWQA